MLPHDLRIAFRTLRRRPGQTALHVLGLSVGLACVLLIGLFVRDELRYDRFHTHSDRIVRLTASGAFEGGFAFDLGGLPSGAAHLMREAVPHVEAVAQVSAPWQGTLRVGEERVADPGFVFADAGFFDVFSFELLSGDAERISHDGAEFITERTARLVFGEENPVGRSMPGSRAEVAGVIADPPEHSHLRFSVVHPLTLDPDWYVGGHPTYVRLRSMADTGAVRARLETELAERLAQKSVESVRVEVMPLTDLYLHAAPYSATYARGAGLLRGKAAYVWAFGAAALLVLLVSCVTYVVLATAQAATRSGEVGVRKAVGAGRVQIVRQLLAETSALTLVALLLALGLALLALPGLNALTDKSLVLSASDPFVWGLTGGVGVVVVGLCGLYPAFVLARMRPVRALSGGQPPRGGWTRRGLVAGQFAVSAGLLLCALTMQRQLDHVGQQALGFDAEQVVHLGRVEAERYDAFKADLLGVPGVRGVTTAPHLPNGMDGWPSFEVASGDSVVRVEFNAYDTDADFPQTFGVPVVAGRYLDGTRPADSSAVVLTERSAAAMGWTPSEAVGQQMPGTDGPIVVGVLADLRTLHLRTAAERHSLFRLVQDARRLDVYARVEPRSAADVLDAAKPLFYAHDPHAAFDYAFLDDAFASFFEGERRLRVLIGIFAAVALLLAALGVAGLAAHAARQRRREIGIRKALGATVAGLVVRLAREFGMLALVGFALGAPAAAWVMQRWLDSFPVRVGGIGSGFGVAAFVVCGGALFVAGVQAWRGARVSPADVLRDE